MESYIVRVLRRQQTNPETKEGNSAVHLDGVVETVDEGGRYRAFHSVDELWSILTGGNRHIQSKGGKTAKNRRR